MSVGSCRVCGQDFFSDPLIAYTNMPKAAQHLPDADDIQHERGEDLTVYQCSQCGLVQLANDPVVYYREVIRAAAVSDVLQEMKSRQFSDFIAKYDLTGKKVIEIGCGRGEFLALLQPMNVQPFGLEYSQVAVAECIARGLHVATGYLEKDTLLENGPFDGFFLLMFLEHFPNPNAALHSLHANLAPDAVGLVEVPNFEMMVRKKLFSEFIADHLLYFTADTLRTTMSVNGFEVLQCVEMRDEYVLSAVVKRRSPVNISAFHACRDTIEAELNGFVNRFSSGKVAIWGAGHQSLAIIAMTRIDKRIKYVVDTASFKQGRFTPATHLPIVSPSSLRMDPVDAVIVIAGSYSDEVADILRKQYDRRLTVVILRDYGLESVA